MIYRLSENSNFEMNHHIGLLGQYEKTLPNTETRKIPYIVQHNLVQQKLPQHTCVCIVYA